MPDGTNNLIVGKSSFAAYPYDAFEHMINQLKNQSGGEASRVRGEERKSTKKFN